MIRTNSKKAGVLTLIALAACSHNSPTNINSTDQMSTTDDPRIKTFESSVGQLSDHGKVDADLWSIAERMVSHGVPGVGVGIIHNGEFVLTKGYGVQSSNSDVPVDEQTVFSAGSVSKLINAALILRLVDEGTLNLDEDVNSYLTSWSVPQTGLAGKHKVTLRMLLAHTSGFSQHGFRDFEPGEPLPTAIQTLNGEAPAIHDPVQLLFTPGEKMKYSGGGITVTQVLVEDVTGLTYEAAAQKYVFVPLGMKRSTFLNPLPKTHGNIARAHDENGKPRALPRGYEAMPEVAASGLWTSVEDMAIFIKALYLGDTFLSEDVRNDMLTRVPQSWHGLGPRLNGETDKFVLHHGGANNSYHTWLEAHPNQGNGMIVLTNGANGRQLAYELRVATEGAFGWSINFPDDFTQPVFE